MGQPLSISLLAAPLGLILVTLAARSSRLGADAKQRFAEGAIAAAFGSALLATLAVVLTGSHTSPLLGVDGIGLSIRLDLLSVTMFTLVSFVGLIVVRYSRNYLAGDARRAGFVARLCLALAAVSLLVLAGNLAQLIVAWVGASLALHRLLVFFHDRPRAIIAGRKKMVAARISDLCLLVGAILLAKTFGTTDIATIAAEAGASAEYPSGFHVATWLLVAAALLKSAQFPFHAWLPEVMETPTPVSALLHAGMINSGGFLVLRFSEVIVGDAGAMTAMVAIGALTAVFGSVVMLTQSTIKGTLAYSTLAQMGLMILECGLGAFSIAMLHIVGHSLYKAHAFLSAGDAVIAESRMPSNRPLPGALAALGVIVAAVAAYGVTAMTVGTSSAGFPATFALATIFALGVVIWAGKQLEGRDGLPAIAAALAIVVGAPALFLGLKVAADRAYAPEFAAASPPEMASLVIVSLALGALGLLSLFQLTGFPTGALARRVYVAIRNGFYIGALWERATGALAVRSGRAHDALGSPEPSADVYAPGPAGLASPHGVADAQAIDAALAQTARAVPPLWPLSDFVAVNPFMGLSDRSFEEATAWLERTAGARTTMPRSFYAQAMDAGEIERSDLAEAAKQSALPLSLEEVERGARRKDRTLSAAPTVTDVARGLWGIDAPRLVVEQIGDWARGYFDRGQATWPSPFEALPPFEAWRAQAMLDRGPELLGLGALRAKAAALPEEPREAIAVCVEQLGLEAEDLDVYFQRLAMRLSGWAGHLRYRGWSQELSGGAPSEIESLVAISLAWECALHESDAQVANAWAIARTELAGEIAADPEREIDLALHRAFELAEERRLGAQLDGANAEACESEADDDPSAQVVFCIDVRSERMRRALERCEPSVRTLGFAGFFGIPIEWITLGEERGAASCPVLLEPGYAVPEAGAADAERVARHRFGATAARAFGAFRSAAVASFGFVEAMGLAYAFKLVASTFVRSPARRVSEGAPKPDIDIADLSERNVGIGLEDRIELAAGVLRAMSLTEGFAPIVVLAAHGSTTVNNPYASGLDCGACGGRSGDPNARVAAAILNDAAVRAGLRDKGIHVPDSTWFAAAVHDTTTDAITWCDLDAVPASHHGAVDRLTTAFVQAGTLARSERAPGLGVANDGDEDEHIVARAADWSQVRPEWGLAGCTAFVAAPRSHTAGKNLDGATFLHEYRWFEDEDFQVLELIMTAPMVVASWINLQYFASTADNRAFGAGDKVLHNVASGLGVIEGNGGDLRVGLPLQSVHDGERFQHRPCRLSVAIAAPIAAIDGVIQRNESIRQLLDHGWIHLVALNDAGAISHRYEGGNRWSELLPGDGEEVAA